MSKDGVLIANHDECMKTSTDAILYDSLWADRKRTVTFYPSGNVCQDDFMFIDFTLAEIKMVNRRQRFAYRSTYTDGLFEIPTFEEAIQHMLFMKDNYTRKVGTDTVPGLYIEMKEPQWYLDNYGIDLAQEVFAVLQKYNLHNIENATNNGIPIII